MNIHEGCLRMFQSIREQSPNNRPRACAVRQTRSEIVVLVHISGISHDSAFRSHKGQKESAKVPKYPSGSYPDVSV